MPKNIETVKETEFAVADVQPPLMLRLGALLIDYILFLALPVGGLIVDHMSPGGFDIVSDRTLWLYAVIFGFLDMVLLPSFTGKSIGKMLTGITIVKADGSRPGFFRVFIRQTLGYILTLCTGGLGFLIAAVNTSGRTLHDLLTGTAEIRAIRKMV